jgi:hypothetical protein
MNLLPEMRSEDLNKRNLQCRYLTVHEDASQIKLDLETNIDIGSINGWRPPKSKSPVGNLI